MTPPRAAEQSEGHAELVTLATAHDDQRLLSELAGAAEETASPKAAGGGSTPSSPSTSRAYAAPRGMVASVRFDERFEKLIRGHWLDSIGNSIIVSKYSDDQQLTAVLTPIIDHPEARDKVFTIRNDRSRTWRCGNANLEWLDEQHQRLVWMTEDGRRSVWSRTSGDDKVDAESGVAFPWLLNHSVPSPWLPLSDVPRDILYDGARIAALLDIRQMIGPRTEPQERLTHILMDHDLHHMRGDYLIPGAESPLWQTLPVSETVRQSIGKRIQRIPHEAYSQRICWHSETEVLVGHHKISCRARDIQVLESRWMLPPKDGRKRLEIARLLALYSVFDNPLSNRRNGVHLGLDPQLRQQCDYELFASPLNAACPNGHFASKWPHVEWRFGSIGSYPTVLSVLPGNAVLCVNPPFTEAYLADVMNRLSTLKIRFRLRVAVPIQEVPWRKKLLSSLPSARLLRTYYDASADRKVEVLHPTLLWEDPRCTPADLGENTEAVSYEEVDCAGCEEAPDFQSAEQMGCECAEASPTATPPPTPVMPNPSHMLVPVQQMAIFAPQPLVAEAAVNDVPPVAEVPADSVAVVASSPTNSSGAVAIDGEVDIAVAAASLAKSWEQRKSSVAAAPAAKELGGSGKPERTGKVTEASVGEVKRATSKSNTGKAAEEESVALNEDEWPSLTNLKQAPRKSAKAKR